MNNISDMYIQGFVKKCEEYSIDPESLIKFAQVENDEDKEKYKKRRRLAAMLEPAFILGPLGGLVGLGSGMITKKPGRDILLGTGAGAVSGLAVGRLAAALNEYLGLDPYAPNVAQVRG